MKEPKCLPCMSSHFDGAHCGLTDWYPEIEKGIQKALKRGKHAVWTTGWYGSKKEIASARITHENGEIQIEVSVSDDFDTDGRGETTIPHTTSLKKIEQAIYVAWELAEENRKDNQAYLGFSVLNRKGQWIETYVRQCGFGWEMSHPPGDNYAEWGFQGEGKMPKVVREKLMAWAESWPEHEEKELKFRGWTIRPWE